MAEKERKVVRAYVLKDGSVISHDYLQKYAIKQVEGSNKLTGDEFSGQYGQDGLVEPLHDLGVLAELMETNTYHYRAVQTKARDTVGLGWNLQPVVEDPSEEGLEEAKEFLLAPHPEETLEEILTKWMMDYEAMGVGYLELIRDKSISPREKHVPFIGMVHIPAHTVRAHRDGIRFVQKRGARKVWFKKIGAPCDVHKDTGEVKDLGTLDPEERATEILSIRNYTARSDYYGAPDVLPALGALLGDKQREEYNIDFFENHAIPAYAVTVTGADLDEETEKQIKRYFQRDLKENRHSTLVLTAAGEPDGQPVEFKFQALSVDVKEASFRLYRKDNRDEILSAHGVPPYRAGIAETGSLGGSTAEESTEIYKQSVINPRQEMVEARINRHILRDGFGVTDYVIKFNDIDTRDENRDTERYVKLFNMGALTPNKIRELIGEERINHPMMDMPFINGIPIDMIGSQVGMHSNEFLQSIKSLHRELVRAVTKG